MNTAKTRRPSLSFDNEAVFGSLNEDCENETNPKIFENLVLYL